MSKPVQPKTTERPKRRPYTDVAFPKWVRTTECTQISSSFLLPTTHGCVKMIETVSLAD